MSSDGRRGTVKPERVGPDGKPASGAKWYFVVDVTPPGVRPRKQAKRRGFQSRKAAQGALTALLNDLAKQQFVAPSKLTFKEFIDTRWLPWLKGQVRPSTYSSYARNLRLHVEPTLGAVPLQLVDAGALMALYAKLLASGRADYREGAGLSIRSVRYVHTILRAALQSAVEWDLLQRNPADRAKPPRQASGPARHETINTWPRETLASFLEQMRDERDYAAWLLLATTGVRRGEALGVGWDALDLDAGRMSVRRSLVDVGRFDEGAQPIYSDPKTARGRRSIALDPATVAALKALRKQQAAERLMLAAGWPDHGLAFTDAAGRPYHPDRFARRFREKVADFGLPAIRVHDLRHSWATLALEAGVHPKVVSERLGHANISITLDVYSHVSPAMQTDAADRVAALILGANHRDDWTGKRLYPDV
jgi:integrase